MQFADIQDGPKVSKDTISLIEASLDATRPDLVIFNGNQIAGYDSAYALTSRKRRWDARPASASSEASGGRYAAALEHTRELVRATIEQLVHPLADRGVPWAVTFGNHDFQCGLDNDGIESICREFPRVYQSGTRCRRHDGHRRETWCVNMMSAIWNRTSDCRNSP